MAGDRALRVVWGVMREYPVDGVWLGEEGCAGRRWFEELVEGYWPPVVMEDFEGVLPNNGTSKEYSYLGEKEYGHGLAYKVHFFNKEAHHTIFHGLFKKGNFLQGIKYQSDGKNLIREEGFFRNVLVDSFYD